jgi:hypothetical protein
VRDIQYYRYCATSYSTIASEIYSAPPVVQQWHHRLSLWPMAEPSPPGIGLSRENEHSHVPVIKPEETVSLHLHPQFQPLSLAYPLQEQDTDIVRPSPHVASERSLECLSEPPTRLQDNYPIVTLSQSSTQSSNQFYFIRKTWFFILHLRL